MRVVPIDEEQGHVALGLALRHLGNTGIFMQATAHPDDENNGLLVMLNRGFGVRTALATATRGNGGQNEIGPEIFEALGVLRTEELAALHRFDGAEQYFTRAVDFGFSFSVEETYEKWGRDEITADYVRLIRTIRPDVILGLRPDGAGGGQHHQASAVIARDAFKLAGDPTKYPQQLKEGLRPWQPRKFYFAGRFGGPSEQTQAARLLATNLAVYDPLLGKTYSEIGTEARSMHKCQGTAQLLALPGPSPDSFQLVESTIAGQLDRDERSLFDGVDTSVAGLAQFAGARPPRGLVEGLAAIQTTAQNAERRFAAEGAGATLQPLVTGLRAVRALRAQLRDPGDRRGRTFRDRLPPPPEGARVSAGHSAGQRRPRRSAGRRRRRGAGPARPRVGGGRQPRRGGRDRQAGELRWIRCRGAVHADGGRRERSRPRRRAARRRRRLSPRSERIRRGRASRR